MALTQDIRFAGRMLLKNKGWTAVAVLAMALGLGANVAIFSVVGLMLWPPFPYPHAEELAYLSQTNAKTGFSRASVSYQDTRDWLGGSTIASIAPFRSRPIALSGEGEPQHVPGMQVTPEFFPTLGIRPAIGRAFTKAEGPDSEARVAIISWALWQGTYRGEQSALGREIRLDGRNYTIVGIMPEKFHFLYQRPDVWIPLTLDQEQRERAYRGLGALARLKPGVSTAQATAEMQSISERIEKMDPKSGLGWRGVARTLQDRIAGGPAKVAASSMFAAVGFVLLIACANVASLLLARGTLRKRELALRTSLGASRGALIRMQLAESLLISLAGGAAGVLSAVWGVPLLKRVAPPNMAVFEIAKLDWDAMVFGLALSLITGLIFGLAPALLLTRGDLARALQSSSRGSTAGRHLTLKSLVVAELALALVLVVASTFMIRSIVRQSTVDVGFDKTNLTLGQVLLSKSRYATEPQIERFFARALENLRHDAGVESAALVETMPMAGNNSFVTIRVDGSADAERDQIVGNMVVSPGYFQALRIPVLAGRDFADSDKAESAKVAIVNETFAKRFWPKLPDPIGKRVRLAGDDSPWLTVVGMARDVHHNGYDDPARPEVYRPHAQSPFQVMTLVARGRGTLSTAGAIRAAVQQVDHDQPVFRLQSFDALMSDMMSGQLATTKVLGFLSMIALALAAIGAYGVMAYTAAQRMREIGIRVALGASRSNVLKMILGSGLVLAVVALVLGIPAAYGSTRLLRALALDYDPSDATAYVGVGLMLAAVAVVACVVPAVRAMRVDPVRVLRED